MNFESQFEHRIHLDAIRGLACIAVVLFHCEVPGFSNGFVGVDVFFVLSGYLISSKLLRELVSNGGLDVAGFYCRRFKRLFPASAAVLIVTAMLYKIFEIPKLVSEHKMSFVAASLYFQVRFFSGSFFVIKMTRKSNFKLPQLDVCHIFSHRE